MERYFYHGIGNDVDVMTLDAMLTIMETGVLKTRGAVGYSGDEYEHVCLYKKNDHHNYSDGASSGSAYDGWINHGFCFIVSPNIEASKTGYFNDLAYENDARFTDLADEWRSNGEIPLDRVVGIGLPLDKINELRCLSGSPVDEFFDEKLEEIVMFADSMDWMIVNSDEAYFADNLDEQLNAATENKIL